MAIILLIALLWILLQTTFFQNWIVKKVTATLSKNLHTKVAIRHVDFQLFNKMLLQGTLILDKKNDTLLYAGIAKVNITDWFFIKKNISLKYAELDDGFINVNRKDSIWNYQFLVDYFSGPEAAKKDTSKSAIKLDIKIVELNKFKIWQQDKWIGQDMLVSLNKLNLYTDDFDANNNIIKINTLYLDHPVFSQSNYKGLRPPRPSSPPAAVNETLPAKSVQWNEDNWVFAIKNFEIKEGNFILDEYTARPVSIGMFDDKHINFFSINGSIRNLEFLKDTLKADIDINAKERSGLQLKKLTTAFRLQPNMMEFSKLELVTNRSHLQNYYSMSYTELNKDMGNFIHAVALDGNFKDSEISSDDLAFFIPGVKTWNRSFLISGIARGTVDNLSAKNMIIRSGKANYFNGDIEIRGLPDINETFINLRSREFRTSYRELANLVPGIRTINTPDVSALGDISFNGTFTGFTNDFVTYGTLKTSLGTVVTDINMKIPDKGLPAYDGRIVTGNFQLGRFIKSSQLGTLSFNGTVSGKGFNQNNINVAVNGFIQQLEFNKYNYQNITAKGNLGNGLFNGFVRVDDPNLKIDDLTGSINFKAGQPAFNVEANVSALNFKNLHFANDNYSLTGRFKLNFSGDNIDNFLGSAGIYNAKLLKDDQRLSFDSLIIHSSLSDGKKYLALQTNELDASVAGNFRIQELPDAFQLFLNKYYPAYINNPKRNVQNQDFVFNISTKNIGEYVLLLNKNLKGFNNSEISGSLNLSQNALNVIIKVPAFSYALTNFTNTDFTANGSLDTLELKGNIEDIVINDSLHFPGTQLDIIAHNDLSDVTIKTAASKTLTEADLSARLQTLSDGFKLYFNPSSFVINNKEWTLEKGGELVLSQKLLMASEVKFVHDDQQLIISTEPSGTGNTNDVLVGLKKLDLEDFMPFVLKYPRLRGFITGNFTIADPFNSLLVDFETTVDKFYFEDDSIGVLDLKGSYASTSGEIIVKAISDNEPYNFTAEMAYKAKDSSENQLKGTLNLTNSNIHILQRYLSTIFSDMNGAATGRLGISGRAKSPKLTGNIKLNKAAVTVDYTKSRYIFEDNSIISFNTDEIDFGSIKLRDTLNNTATLSGKLYHDFFNNFFFNELNFRTDKKNGDPGKFVLLNTSANDNKQFYGSVIGDAELSLNGPLSDMRMTIRGEPTDSSHIYLPTGETAETGKIDYIEFIKFGREMENSSSGRQATILK